MEISKLNPIGYSAKTENGNTYKKSNIATTALVGTMAAIDASPYIFKNNRVAQLLSSNEAFKDIAKLFKIDIPKKLQAPLAAAGIGLDLICGYLIGRSIDKLINQKRMAKADAQAIEK